MRKHAQIIIVLLAALVGGLLLYSAPLRAADPTQIACPNGQTIFLEGQAPPGEAVLAYLRTRPVGGGLADTSGHYRIPLTTQERPGIYPVEVRLRSSRAVVGTFTCYVDFPIDAEPTGTPTLGGAAPVGSTTRTATAAPTGAGGIATPRPRATASPTGTGTVATTTGTAGTPTGSTTPTPTLGTTTPTITTTATVTSTVSISWIGAYDPAHSNEPEYVEIENTGSSAVDISSWRLSNSTRGSAVPTFTFPSFTLNAVTTISVCTKFPDSNTENCDFTWDHSENIWRVGDKAELRDKGNNLIATATPAN